MPVRILPAAFALVLLAASCSTQTATPPAPGSPDDLVQRGEKLSRDGKQDEALALYAQALTKSPDLYLAHLDSGIALDLKGDYAAAREHLTKAIAVAPETSKQQALRGLAFSYAFQTDANNAAKEETEVFSARLDKGDFIGAAEIANELARIYLESGDLDNAYKWYKAGFDTSARKADVPDAGKNLWLFRWENAQARISARRGNADEARQHVAAAKAALDKANNPDQLRFYPYLTGYVAFYLGDYKTAIAELQQADQRDPFNLALLGEAFEKAGNTAQARAYYGKVLEINIHNPANAFARPLARKRLGSLRSYRILAGA